MLDIATIKTGVKTAEDPLQQFHVCCKSSVHKRRQKARCEGNFLISQTCKGPHHAGYSGGAAFCHGDGKLTSRGGPSWPHGPGGKDNAAHYRHIINLPHPAI